MTEQEHLALQQEAEARISGKGTALGIVDNMEKAVEKSGFFSWINDMFHSEPIQTVQDAALQQAQVQITQLSSVAAREFIFGILEEMTEKETDMGHAFVRSKGFRMTSTLAGAVLATPWLKRKAREFQDSDYLVANAFEMGSNLPITMFLQEGGDFLHAKETVQQTVRGLVKGMFNALRSKGPEIDAAVAKHMQNKQELQKSHQQFKGNKR